MASNLQKGEFIRFFLHYAKFCGKNPITCTNQGTSMSEIRRRLRTVLLKDLMIDLEDHLRADALKAHQVIRDGFEGLTPLRARALEGQARFRICEQGFEDVCRLHGGHLLDGGIIPKTELKIFQPFMRFEHEGQGVILALASMPEAGLLPTKNKSRLAGVTINFDLSLRLDFDGKGPKIGDIFAVLLVARDRERAGKIEEIALGLIESNFASFLFYEPLDTFLSETMDAPEPTEDSSEVEQPTVPQVTLKKTVKPFIPPEAPKSEQEGDGSKGR